MKGIKSRNFVLCGYYGGGNFGVLNHPTFVKNKFTENEHVNGNSQVLVYKMSAGLCSTKLMYKVIKLNLITLN